ncbi:glycosyltransferase family 2 protein [Prosthecomicrobium sp. N25]|uniref:glycosyltransferase family 2 protein n=1 Tax=Prosthecomicrobium sp. N25 TaxID=3129254 RepID=UPI003078198E
MADPAAAPAVTAAIVVLDGERFIGEALASIRDQTFRDWELVVVDDGSTDRTASLVEAFGAERPGRVCLLRHPGGGNRGIAASRNLAIARARGRYVAFLDADDVWLPEKLAEQVAILDADPELGLVYGRSLIWYGWSPAAPRADHYYPLGVEADRRHEPPVLFELLMRNEAQTPTTCNAMIRRSLFDRLGPFDPRFRTMFEDLTFFAKALATTPAYVSDRTWAKYRQHPESCTAVSAARGADDLRRLRFLLWLGRSLPPEARGPRVLAALAAERRRAARAVARGFGRRLRRRLAGWIR